MFARIIDSSISDTELDEIASQLDDFKFSGFNQVQSTGKLKVTTKKTGKNGGWLQRTFVVRSGRRRGWGVLNIDAHRSRFHGNGRRMTNQQGGQLGGATLRLRLEFQLQPMIEALRRAFCNSDEDDRVKTTTAVFSASGRLFLKFRSCRCRAGRFRPRNRVWVAACFIGSTFSPPESP